jgi:hypothetical protein
MRPANESTTESPVKYNLPLYIAASALIGLKSNQIQAILDSINPPPIGIEVGNSGDEGIFTNPNIQ